MLESLSHAENSFVTLTYRPEDIPPGGTLNPRHYQLWLNRLRGRSKNRLRFYLVGEYGDQSQRPHYHAALFGHPGCLNLHQDSFHRAKCGCYACDLIRDTWGHGNTDCAFLTPDSAQYIAGYVTKKLTKHGDPRLGGRHPEFARMSLKPGIGGLSIPHIADVLTSEFGVDTIVRSGDVPMALKSGNKNLPLGKYLRRKLRAHLGFKEKSCPKEILSALQQENAEVLKEASKDLKRPKFASWRDTASQIYVDLNKQKVMNLETRLKIYTKKGSL